MAIKTFTTGEVLTASDTNTYLANAGLVFVKSQTVGSGVSSVTVSDAFSATYDTYRIVMSGGVGSGNIQLQLRFGSTTTDYYGSILYNVYSASTPAAIGTNAGNSCTYVGGGDTSFISLICDIGSPFVTKPTTVYALYQDNTAFGSSAYRLANSTSYTAFTLSPLSGTITGGTITVYGYRKA